MRRLKRSKRENHTSNMEIFNWIFQWCFFLAKLQVSDETKRLTFFVVGDFRPLNDRDFHLNIDLLIISMKIENRKRNDANINLAYCSDFSVTPNGRMFECELCKGKELKKKRERNHDAIIISLNFKVNYSWDWKSDNGELGPLMR